jgi:hypothetical protein
MHGTATPAALVHAASSDRAVRVALDALALQLQGIDAAMKSVAADLKAWGISA